MIESMNLNIIPNGVTPVCHVSQYDVNRTIRINLFEGNSPYIIQSGDRFFINVRKPDNTVVVMSVNSTQGNSYVDIVTDQNMTACVGETLCQLKITNDSKNIGTLNFIMLVERDVLADGIASQSVIEDLDALVEESAKDYVIETVDEISSQTVNLANVEYLKNATGITYNNGEFYGTSGAFNSLDPLPIVYTENTQYTISLSAHIETESATTNGLQVIVIYTDNTQDLLTFKRNQTSYARKALTTAANKTVQRIRLTYSGGTNDIWYVKDLQVQAGVIATPYLPYKTAQDLIARNKTNVIDKLDNDVLYLNNFGYASYDVTTRAIAFDTTRIGNYELIPVNKGDIIRIKAGTGYKHAWRIWSDTNNGQSNSWTTDNEEFEVIREGVFGIKYADSVDATRDLDLNTFDGAVSIIRDSYINSLKAQINTNTMGLAYSWWVNNRVIDSYGNLYFGYISDKNYCGVACRFPNGTIYKKDLFLSNSNDDHNAPSVIILPIDNKEYICVIGSTGHNADNKINCYIASEPNSITCDFNNRTFEMTAPEGYDYQNSYSQAFFVTFTQSDIQYNRICNFFRVKQRNLTQDTYSMIWCCAISDDYGLNWSVYRVFVAGRNIGEKLFYMTANNTTQNDWLKRVLLQYNTTYIGEKSINGGFVNMKTLNILNGNGTSIEKPMTLIQAGELANDPALTIAEYDDFTPIIDVDENHALRILDVWEDGSFLYAKAVENTTTISEISDWILYKSNFDNSNEVEIAHLGMAFFKGSGYVTGANFVGDNNHIIYSKNDSETQDGKHSLHYVELNDGVIEFDRIIKTSSQTIARPMRYDQGSIMMLTGKYREGQGTKYLTWHFGISFIDSI